MAKIDNIFSGGKGRLGNLILYEMNGMYIVRTKPKNHKNTITPGKLTARKRFAVMNEFLCRFNKPLRITFADQAVRRTALNVAQSYNLKTALAGEYPDIYVDKGKVLLSRGPLPLPSNVWLEARPEGFMVHWENGPEYADASPNDVLMVFALPATGKVDYRLTETRRSAGQYLWINAKPKPELPDVWISFCNDTMTQWSDSRYVG